jgi:hypothetical protein
MTDDSAINKELARYFRATRSETRWLWELHRLRKATDYAESVWQSFVDSGRGPNE